MVVGKLGGTGRTGGSPGRIVPPRITVSGGAFERLVSSDQTYLVGADGAPLYGRIS